MSVRSGPDAGCCSLETDSIQGEEISPYRKTGNEYYRRCAFPKYFYGVFFIFGQIASGGNRTRFCVAIDLLQVLATEQIPEHTRKYQ